MTAGRTINSQSRDWCTPGKYVDAVHSFFSGPPDLDPCSNQWSIVGARTEWALPDHDGLSEEWDYSTIYVNPPYGADRKRNTTIRDWLMKCATARAQYGAEILALVPVATNTGHWKKYVWGQAAGISFLYDTRLRFLVQGQDCGKGAPMACAMVYWGSFFQRFFDVFIAFGAVVDVRPLQEVAVGDNHGNLFEFALNSSNSGT